MEQGVARDAGAGSLTLKEALQGTLGDESTPEVPRGASGEEEVVQETVAAQD